MELYKESMYECWWNQKQERKAECAKNACPKAAFTSQNNTHLQVVSFVTPSRIPKSRESRKRKIKERMDHRTIVTPSCLLKGKNQKTISIRRVVFAKEGENYTVSHLPCPCLQKGILVYQDFFLFLLHCFKKSTNI